MIENLLDAYEGMRKEKEPLLKRISGMTLVDKVVLIFMFFGMGFLVALCIFQVETVVLWFFGFAGILWVMVEIAEKVRHEKWDDNTEKYNKSLDTIRELLVKYDLYEKNKIKQLIRKYRQDIENVEKEKNKREKGYGGFIGTYIFPIVAFVAGRIGSDYELNDVIQLGLIAIIFTVCIKIIGSSAFSIIDMVKGEPLEKRKRFVKRLQDLVDRDFEILDNDLIG